MNHLLRIKEMDCSLCGASGPSDAHHILEGRCPGRKSPDMLAIAVAHREAACGRSGGAEC
jgi:hypothetical protein